MDEALIRKQEEELQHTGRYYKHICFLCVPLLFVSCYLYGLRPLLLCGFALLMGNLCDRLISLLRRRVYRPGDYSNESFALVIALLMPATVDWYVLAAAIVAGVLIGKEVFGGYGSYPFNPAAVGYAVAAVSWPEQVFRYPTPYTSIPLWDASGVATASTISDTLRSGGLINLSGLSLALGEYAAPMGAGSALVLAACGLFLWVQKDIKLSAALSFLVTAGVIVFLFPRQLGLTEDASFAVSAMFRLRCVRDELLTGAMIFSAVFLLNEPYTCATTGWAASSTASWWGPSRWASATSASMRRASASRCWRSTASPAGSTAPKSISTSCSTAAGKSRPERGMPYEAEKCRTHRPRPGAILPP